MRAAGNVQNNNYEMVHQLYKYNLLNRGTVEYASPEVLESTEDTPKIHEEMLTR